MNEKPPFKADVVGSLLRPPQIFQARERHAKGELSAQTLREVETECVREAVAMQRAVGLDVCTDGDFHRRHWFMDFLEKLDGVEIRGGLPVKFHNEGGDVEFSPPRFEIHGKVERSRDLSVEDFRSLASIARDAGLMPKQPIPSPTILHFRGGRAAIDRGVYPEIGEFFADLAEAYRAEIAALYAAGCRYVQIDDTNLVFLCDPNLRENARKIGEDPDTLPGVYVDLLNRAVAGRPDDLTICVHMCRGNHAGAWVAEGGYDAVAQRVFGGLDVDGLFLEYDSPRAGSFAPLRYLGAGKVAVLGLVTTKRAQLESQDELKRRIDEAAAYVPIERLALSPQCGFASTIEGNPLTFDDQRRKLELVVETASQVWS